MYYAIERTQSFIVFYFPSLGISSFQSQAENAVLDLDADEASAVTRTKNNKRW